MTTLLIINYIIWLYDAINYDKKVEAMNIDEIQKDIAYQLKPIVILLSAIPYSSLINLFLWPIIKKYFNL
jgi:hypothetical protein